MFVVINPPHRKDKVRADVAAHAAAQTIVADFYGICVPCVIDVPNPKFTYQGYHTRGIVVPPCPLAVALAGPAGVFLRRGEKKLVRLTPRKILAHLERDHYELVVSDPATATVALDNVKQILSDNRKLFSELVEETYTYGSYLPMPKITNENVTNGVC